MPLTWSHATDRMEARACLDPASPSAPAFPRASSPSQRLPPNSMAVPQKLTIKLPSDLEIPLLRMYPKELKAGFQKVIRTPIFIAALFTVDKRWKQLRCLLMAQWIKQNTHKKEGDSDACYSMEET